MLSPSAPRRSGTGRRLLAALASALVLTLGAGVLAGPGAPTASAAADTSRPTAPRNLVATAGSGKVTLKWSASTDNVGVAYYKVWRQVHGQTGAYAGQPTTTTLTDTAGVVGRRYEYVVRAFDAAGNYSDESNLVSASPTAAPTPTASPTPSPPAAGSLLFEDTFDGPAGSAPDGSKWSADTTGFRDNGGEWQYYTNRPSNVDLDGNGSLRIRARRESYGGRSWTSARLSTEPAGRNAANAPKFTFYTGRLEARIKVPTGQGLLPQFWALGRNDYTNKKVGWPAAGELDVMEIIGQDPFTTTANAHMPGHDFSSWPSSALRQSNLSSGFHTYAMDWYPDRVTFSLDGQAFSTMTKSSVQAAGGSWKFDDPDNPFWVILNLCVGNPWPGAPSATTPSPAAMLVDYVRVWSH
jgi:beta-glucanase (GH16 family)